VSKVLPETENAAINPSLFDAYAPAAMAERVEMAGAAKAELQLLPLFTLAVLAGAFIAFGAMLFTLVMTGNGLGLGPGRLLGGIAFSLGLILVVVGGAELFTGNNLIVMAWADGKVSAAKLLRNWSIVFVGNIIGSFGMAVLVSLSGTLELGGGAVSASAVAIAEAKAAIPADEAFFRGLLCNSLVCLAVWLSFAAHTVSGKTIAIIFPVSAFVALGFEHSIANAYFMPIGYLAGADITAGDFLGNMLPVTAGNIVGGSVFVALVYWVIYRRKS